MHGFQVATTIIQSQDLTTYVQNDDSLHKLAPTHEKQSGCAPKRGTSVKPYSIAAGCKVFSDLAWTNQASTSSTGIQKTRMGVHIQIEGGVVKASIQVSAVGNEASSPLQAEAMAFQFAVEVAS